MLIIFEELMAAVDEAKATKGQPTAIIMKSVKGQECFIYGRNNAGWHGSAPNEEQYNQTIAELDKIIKRIGGESVMAKKATRGIIRSGACKVR